MSYLLFIQVHKKLLEKTIKQFKIIAHASGLSFRSEVYTGYHSRDSYVNLYLVGDKLVQIKEVWGRLVSAVDTGEISSSIKEYWLAKVIKNKQGDSYDFSILLANCTLIPNSKEIAHNFLESDFSCKKYLEQRPEEDNFERYELMIQIRKKVSKNIIRNFKMIACAHQLEFQACHYNKKENHINFFITADTLQKIKSLWRDILVEVNDKKSSITFVKQYWAVVLYADYRTDEYVVLADSELLPESLAIASNFLDDNFSWYDYQDQFPEERILRKYDLELKLPKKKARKMIFELKKIAHQYQLIFGIGRDDEKVDEIDFYIIGYSYEKMKNIWQEVLSTVNDSNSSLTFLRNKWTVSMWRSNLKDNSILLASPLKPFDKKPVAHYLPNDDPFVR